MRTIKLKSDRRYYSIISMGIIALMILLLGYAMGYPEIWQEKRAYKEALAPASEFALEYIGEKYGFEARIIEDEENDRMNRLNNSAKYVSCIGCIEKPEDWNFTFGMEANGREFTVNVCISPEEAFASDNYQYEEIKAAAISELETEISRSLSDGKILQFSMESFFSEYYDGSNIDKFLENSWGHIEMIFPNADFSSPYWGGVIDKLTWEWGFDITFASFDTQERTEDFINYLASDESEYFRGLYGYYRYEAYAPYITDFICVNNGEISTTDIFEAKSCGEFDCRIFPGSGEITEAAVEDMTGFFKEYNEEYCLEAPLSRAYKVNENNVDVCIYYPLNKLEGRDIDLIGAAWCGKRNVPWDDRGIARAEICGDYAVFRMAFGSMDDIMFMLVDNTGQEKYIPGENKGTAD